MQNTDGEFSASNVGEIPSAMTAEEATARQVGGVGVFSENGNQCSIHPHTHTHQHRRHIPVGLVRTDPKNKDGAHNPRGLLEAASVKSRKWSIAGNYDANILITVYWVSRWVRSRYGSDRNERLLIPLCGTFGNILARAWLTTGTENQIQSSNSYCSFDHL